MTKLCECGCGQEVRHYRNRFIIGHYNRGKRASEASRQKMSDAKKGTHHSEASKLKMSESKMGEKNPMYGKHHSEVIRQKISETKKLMVIK